MTDTNTQTTNRFWTEMMRTWGQRSDHVRNSTLEGINSFIDTGAYLTRMGIGIAYGLSSILHGQLTEQIDDSFRMLRWPERKTSTDVPGW